MHELNSQVVKFLLRKEKKSENLETKILVTRERTGIKYKLNSTDRESGLSYDRPAVKPPHRPYHLAHPC